MEKIKSLVISLVVIAVVYGAINFIFVGVQDLYWSKDTAEIKQIDEFLKGEESKLLSLETEIENQTESLRNKEIELDRLKSAGLINYYNLAVDDFNLLLQKSKTTADNYESRVTEYNNKVERINKLSKDSETRWYVIPVPTGRRSSH